MRSRAFAVLAACMIIVAECAAQTPYGRRRLLVEPVMTCYQGAPGGIARICTPGVPFCMSTILRDGRVIKSCASRETCDKARLAGSECAAYRGIGPPPRKTCRYCCQVPGCNINVVPNPKDAYTG